jgi:2'-5' RNA ligase
MVALQAAMDQELYEVGFAMEARRFKPHLTIGRTRKGKKPLEPLVRLLEENADFHAGHTSVQEVILFSSVLEKGGPIYEVLGRAPLGVRC